MAGLVVWPPSNAQLSGVVCVYSVDVQAHPMLCQVSMQIHVVLSCLPALAYAFIDGALNRSRIWTPLIIASTISPTIVSNIQPLGGLRGLSTRDGVQRNFQLIPMLPVELHDMLKLVQGAWQRAVPDRKEGYNLHESIK